MDFDPKVLPSGDGRPRGAPEKFETRRGIALLWFGVLGGPVLWFTHQQVELVLVPWVCGHAQTWILHAVTAACLAGVFAAGAVAWKNRTENAPLDAPEVPASRSRSRFMGTVGLMASVLFALVIIAQEVPNLLLDPCQR